MTDGPVRFCAKHQTWDNCVTDPVKVVKKPGRPQSSEAKAAAVPAARKPEPKPAAKTESRKPKAAPKKTAKGKR